MAKPLRIGLFCALAGAVSVAIFAPVPIFDPAAWMVWSGEMVHRRLALRAGPSWKPLPVVVAAPFAMVSWKVGWIWWLFIVRSCTVGTSVLLWRLATRGVSGPGNRVFAGLVAALLPFTIGDWVQLSLGGGSEPVLMVLLLGAVQLHLSGRWRWALVLATGAGLLRPEVWIFLSLYGMWLLLDQRRRAVVPLLLGAVAQFVGWFLIPATMGSDPLQASRHARAYVGSEVPLGEFFARTFDAMGWSIWPLALIGVVMAWRRPDRVVVMLTAASLVWIAAVGAETFLGFAGIGRYSLPALVVFCGVAGYGAGQVLQRLERDMVRPTGSPLAWGAAAGVVGALVLQAAVSGVPNAHARWHKVVHIDHKVEQADALIAKAGGMKRLLAICGTLGTNWSYSSSLAWSQHQTLGNISTRTSAPGVLLILDRAWSKFQPVPPRRTRTKRILMSLPPWKVVQYESDVTCRDYVANPGRATRRMIEGAKRDATRRQAATR